MDGWMGVRCPRHRPRGTTEFPTLFPCMFPSGGQVVRVRDESWALCPGFPPKPSPFFLLIPCIFQTLLIQIEEKNLLVMCATDLNFEWVVDKFNRANMTRTREEYVQFPCILARNILHFWLRCFFPFLKVEGSLRYLCFKSRATFPLMPLSHTTLA